MNQLADFYRALPRYDAYIHIYAETESLPCNLEELYNDYIEFSLLTIGYLQISPWSLYLSVTPLSLWAY
jgi:hypothetical protein